MVLVRARSSWSSSALENEVSGICHPPSGYSISCSLFCQPSPLKENNTVSFTELYSLLQPAILNHSRVLRISALQILSSNLVGGSAGEQDVVRRCLQGEEVSLDAAGVRERVLRIGRVGIAVRDGESAAADLCTRWLMGK